VLFKLASSSATGGDALAVLHELQVHQVELDMQHEELCRSNAELESDLIRLRAYIEQAPAALLVVDDALTLCEINPAGARLLGTARNDVLGSPLTTWLSASGGEALQKKLAKMLASARSGAVPETFELPLPPQDGVARKLLCSASFEASSGRFLLVLMAPASASPDGGW